MLLDLYSQWKGAPAVPSALSARESVAAVLAVVGSGTSGAARESVAALFTVYAPPETYEARVSAAAMLAPYAANPGNVPRASQASIEAVYSTALPAQEQTLAWTFTMDGHAFYVLDLGTEGTFLYDGVTQQWCEFQSQNSVGWNLRNGCTWYDFTTRIVGGDSTGPYVWELDETAVYDDGFRDIIHAATAGIMLRDRVYVSLAELRIAASSGLVDDTTGIASIGLTYSDDGGQTYQGPFELFLDVGSTADGQQDIRFSSLGAFMAPGRVIQISDYGGLLRLDGVDAMLDDYDGGAAEGPEDENGGQ
jgi:hypothetical protein